jgi:4-amino-4-deoxy-L-arabinose transferase-like glycosyltransferase
MSQASEGSTAPSPPSPHRLDRVDAVLALAVFAVALLVRGIVLWCVGDLATAGDENFYWKFSEKAQQDVNWTVVRPPAWGYLVWYLRDAYDSVHAVRLVCTVVGAATVPLFYLLGRKVSGRPVALVAAGILAFYPEHVAFSHYLWAEAFFGFQAVLAVLLFFVYFERPNVLLLVLAAAVAGLALLTKVFAAILFVAFLLALLFQRIPGKLVHAALAIVVFLVPVTVYSLQASERVGRRVVLSETGLMSMRQAVGLDSPGGLEYHPEEREERTAELKAHLRERPLRRAYRDVRRQLFNLWSPQSFVAVRLDPKPRWQWADDWDYGLRGPWQVRLMGLVTASYVFAFLLGFCGLFLGERTTFRSYCLWALLGLSATAIFAFLASRYRLSFLFLLFLPAAQLLCAPRAHFDRLLQPRRLVPLILVLALFARIVLEQADTIGRWG